MSALKFCCEEIEKQGGTNIAADSDGVDLIGCCGDCNAFSSMKFCPFCGTAFQLKGSTGNESTMTFTLKHVFADKTS